MMNGFVRYCKGWTHHANNPQLSHVTSAMTKLSLLKPSLHEHSFNCEILTTIVGADMACRHGMQTWHADMACGHGMQTCHADMACRHGTRTWHADMACEHGMQTWHADMACRHGMQIWHACKHGMQTRHANMACRHGMQTCPQWLIHLADLIIFNHHLRLSVSVFYSVSSVSTDAITFKYLSDSGDGWHNYWVDHTIWIDCINNIFSQCWNDAAPASTRRHLCPSHHYPANTIHSPDVGSTS